MFQDFNASISIFITALMISSVSLGWTLNLEECKSLYDQAESSYYDAAHVQSCTGIHYIADQQLRSSLDWQTQHAKNTIAAFQKANDTYNKVLNDTESSQSNSSKMHKIRSKCREHSVDCETQIGNEQKNLLGFRSQKMVQKNTAARNAEENAAQLPYYSDQKILLLKKAAELYQEGANVAQEIWNLHRSLINPNDKEEVKSNINTLTKASARCRESASQWSTYQEQNQSNLWHRITLLKSRSIDSEKNCNHADALETRFMISELLAQVIKYGSNNGDQAKQELADNSEAIKRLQVEKNRPSKQASELTKEELRSREQIHRNQFFTNDQLLHPRGLLEAAVKPTLYPSVTFLDGQTQNGQTPYLLFIDQYVRFLVETKGSFPELLVKVIEKDKVIYQEQVAIAVNVPFVWEHHVITDGLVFIPNNRLKTDFGLDLRIQIVPRSPPHYALIISQKGNGEAYQYAISLNDSTPLYSCLYSAPPPWQLATLRKPALPRIDQPLVRTESVQPFSSLTNDAQPSTVSYPVLDAFVEEMKSDPLLLAQYVYNEIAFVEPFLRQVDEVYIAPGIRANPYMTYLEKQGTPWEQCQLLVYLLQRAGYEAVYAQTEPYLISHAIAEKLLFIQPIGSEDVLVKYPWVFFHKEDQWISLLPWLKEFHIEEGYDLYTQLPDSYASAERWIQRYLVNDPNILKHIAHDGNDTAGILFVRFVQEELKKKGLAIRDVGIQRVQLKKQFTDWSEFPRPAIQSEPRIIRSIEGENLIAHVDIEAFSLQDSSKRVSVQIPTTQLDCTAFSVKFSEFEPSHATFHLAKDKADLLSLKVGPKDNIIGLNVIYNIPFESDFPQQIASNLQLLKGTNAALCMNFGSASPKIASQFYDQFLNEKDETDRLHAFLGYIGAVYFENCARAEQQLAKLHKVLPDKQFGCGLAQIAPGRSKQEPQKTLSGLQYPRVDMQMFTQSQQPLSIKRGDGTIQFTAQKDPIAWHEERSHAKNQFTTLALVDGSSNEHQILRDFFEDPNAISTVKLLQLQHQKHQENGLHGPGFLTWVPTSFKTAHQSLEIAEELHFPHLRDIELKEIQNESPAQWKAIEDSIKDHFGYFTYAYMTPRPYIQKDGNSQHIATLTFHPNNYKALISSDDLVLNGGFGSRLPVDFRLDSTQKFSLIQRRAYSGFDQTLQNPVLPSLVEVNKIKPDVRQEHKHPFAFFADPVDVMTGAFYIDEVDLVLPGPFPLTIRRNYNSQNPIQGSFGYGWKLSLNPYLIEQDNKLFAAEEDGTVISYRFNEQSNRWEAYPEDNPDLCNLKQDPFNPIANPFSAYIENNTLYRADGTRRVFKDGLLQTITSPAGNTLTFTYTGNQLSRIESSYGTFCRIEYTPDDLVKEIFAQDGRCITYTYNIRGELYKVTLPNEAEITYDYDGQHQIVRETKPNGMILENDYENGKVKAQRSPMGPAQQMATMAYFDYQKGFTTVTDGEGGKTTYFIKDNRIYKVIDPEGDQILHAWFIDDKSWFDPQTEQIAPWDRPGGYAKSLKSITDKRGLTTHYLYDKNGNPKEIEILGIDLTGDFQTHSSITFQFNEKNLCERSLHLDRETKITYDDQLPYFPKRTEKYVQNTLLSYTDFTYNSHGQIIKEDRSGASVEWEYNSSCGLPSKKTENTNTDDPAVITTYDYNKLGQCTQIITADTIQQDDYDIVGNKYRSQVYSKDGHLLSATYSPYDLSNRPRWIQGASPNQTLRLEYLPSGEIKAKIQELDALGHAAYTLYDYDTRGFLIEEIDPRGYRTKHEYDGIGRVKVKTVENFSTHYTYEPGDLIASTTTPAGFITTYDYTANGLLKKQTNPDGTKSTFVYDLLARPKILTKNGQVQHIIYDDIHRKIIRKSLTSETTEEFDLWGNCIRFTDAAGYIWEKTYDALGRIKTQTNPNGEQSLWSYQGDTVICTTASGEKIITHYAAGEVISIQCFDVDGILIASSEVTIDPVNQTQTAKAGDILTTTQTNAFGLVKSTQTGTNQISYEYDHSANCTTITDGEKRITTQEFDGLNRLAKKTLPDGSVLTYIYDSDSNLCETHLPNGAVWKATHDEMGRKRTEELYATGQTKERWEYTYENGLLATAKDPMNRIHTYEYDDFKRLKEESVDGWKRKYTYDPRGLVETIEQWKMLPDGYATEYSRIERSYDESGRLASELAYLNNQLLFQTTQHWASSKRTLDIGSHTREFFYQGERLTRVLATPVDLHYTYCLDGSLQQKITPVNTTTWHYNSSALPEKISTNYTSSSTEQLMTWDFSGKMRSFTSSDQAQKYRYTPQGYLAFVNEDIYTYDFGSRGIGVLTETPLWSIPDNGIDPFGKTIAELRSEKLIPIHYDEMGQVKAHQNQTLEWNPWGQLVKVTDPSYVWEATYDAFGRRLQTRYTPSWDSTLTTTSFYDPEEEFQEIGLSLNGKTFWKIYGPETCDAVMDDTEVIYLSYNALKHLSELITSKEIVEIPSTLSPYGPLKGLPFIKPELYRLASSLTWHSKAPDLTGFIWMGARYYDPSSCKFLSPDPIGYPINMNLYAYAGGDPINFFDPDGRLASLVYKYTLSTYNSLSTNLDNHLNNFKPAFNSVADSFSGAFDTSYSDPFSPLPIEPMVSVHSFVTFAGGFVGKAEGLHTFLSANRYPDMSIAELPLPGRFGKRGASKTPKARATNEPLEQTASKRLTKKNARHNLEVHTGESPARDIHAHHTYPQELETTFIEKGINIHHPKNLVWLEGKLHLKHAKRYNAEWWSFFETNQEATEAQIYAERKKIMDICYKKKI